MPPYATSLDHVLAELGRVDLQLRAQVARALQIKKVGDPFEGLYITDGEVEALAAESTGLPRWARTPSSPAVDSAMADLTARIASRNAENAADGPRLRLAELERCFGANPFDIDAILIALAPELDRRYERIFAYLQDDVTRRRPSVDLILNVLSPAFTAKLALRERFSHGAPLVRHRLVELIEDPDHPRPTLLGRHVKLDDRILGFLLGSNEVDAELRHHVRVLDPRGPGAPGVSPGELPMLERAHAECVTRERVVLHLHGARGVGKQRWAAALAAALGQRLLVVDGEALAADRRHDLASLALRAVREAALQGAALYWSGFDALRPDDRRAQRRAVLDALAAQPGPSFLAGTQPWQPEPIEDRSAVISIDLARPEYAEREGLWRRALGDGTPPAVTAAIPELASKFRLTGGEIEAAAATALARAHWRSPERPTPTVEELHAGCRAQSQSRLDELARKIEPRRGWSDLVLPPEALQQLHEICGHVRHRARVFETWGFGRKLSQGKGLSALFCGPSGTGKTLAAEIMAGELGLELYKIDLSGVVSKYIGETEKNLARVFAEAETMSGVLFFDEADALFGKRSEVKDAHDRYANVETSYLLQRMEEYEGVSILATNLRRNMDDAFLRRIAFVVQFPQPEEPERLRIWQGVFPAATPRADDVDLAFLARQFKLAGGNIKNIALAAAFLAADDGGDVAMRHLLRATRRELSKLGKTLAAHELGAYGSLLDA